MATRASVKMVDLVISSGTNVSNIIDADSCYGDAEQVLLTGENVNDAAITYTLEVTDDFEPSAAGVWSTYQQGTPLADFVVSNVNGKAYNIPPGALAATGLRIKSSANVTANRTWGSSKQYICN